MKVAGSAAHLGVRERDDLAAKREAIAALYETHHTRLARYLAARIGNVHDAEQLASEVFVRALRAASTYKDTGAPIEAWLFRIAHNLAVNHLRDKSRRGATVPLEDVDLVADWGDPLAVAERAEEIRALHAAMWQLTEAQRQVISLRLSGQMTSEQVAATMGKKAGAIREMQSAAMRRLRQILGAR